MKAQVDVFVVGGGPAGLVAGIAARAQGFTVMVADGSGYPIDKPCGEGLLPETRAVLGELNIQMPRAIGQRLRGIRLVQTGHQVCAEFPGGQGIGIRRTILHELLVTEAEERGVQLLWRSPVTGIDGNSVRLGHGSVAADWIVGADGSGSRVRKWSGLEATRSHHQRFATRRHYRVKPWTDYMEIYWGECVQGYVTPLSRNEICIVVMADEAQNANFERALEKWPDLKTRLADREISSRERGAINSMRSLENVCRGRIALVGDASGSVDAITGEGLRLAFSQAILLAEGMRRGDLGEYQQAHRRLTKRPTRLGKLLVLLGRHATIRQRAIKTMAARPEIFQEFLAIHGGYSSASRILGMGARMGWEFLSA